MLRLIGVLLLASGPAAVGFRAAWRLSRRPAALRELAGAMEQIEREVTFRLTPLPRLFQRLSQDYGGPAGALFTACLDGMEQLGSRSMGEVWRQALAKSGLDLDARSLRAMEELGEVLGRYDEAGLRTALERVRAELTAGAEQAEREWEQKGRMVQVLGLTAGALLVILLV